MTTKAEMAKLVAREVLSTHEDLPPHYPRPRWFREAVVEALCTLKPELATQAREAGQEWINAAPSPMTDTIPGP